MVVVPDREAELKQRLEDDENDKRVSMAALRLAPFEASATAKLRLAVGAAMAGTIGTLDRMAGP